MSVNVTAKEIFLLEITENHDFDINFFLYQKLRKTYILTKINVSHLEKKFKHLLR